MEVNKNDWDILQNAIKEWEQDAKISPDQAHALRESISIKRSDRQLLAKYLFIISLSCALLAFGAIFIDEKLLEKLKQYFSLSNIIIAAITGLISIAWFWYAFKRKNKLNSFTYEVYMILGALCSLCCLVYIFKDINADRPHTALLMCSTIVLFVLSILLRSAALWACSIISIILWFGAFSSNHSINNLFLGMNLVVRYTAFGLLTLILSFVQAHIKSLSFTQRITFGAGLLIFLLGMWGVSVFGNFSTLDEWWKVRQTHELAYAILFGAVAVIIFYFGIRYKDAFVRDMGIAFLLINLYTRYFEYFWNTMNKGIFFLILAVTFGFLGKWLERKKRSAKKPADIKT